jgi:hypothetical protein
MERAHSAPRPPLSEAASFQTHRIETKNARHSAGLLFCAYRPSARS